MVARLNDPGLISRDTVYSSLARGEKSKTMERTLRRFCSPEQPSVDDIPAFLQSYNAYYTSYRTDSTDSYSTQFIFFFTPTEYTELAIIGERLANFIEDSRDLAGGDMEEFERLEHERDSMLDKRDNLLGDYRDNPKLIQSVPSMVIVFEQMFAGNTSASYNFSGVFQGVFNQVCHTR